MVVPNPDLSLWTSAVETDPENTFALSNLALVYLRFNPPKADQALVYLNRALQLSQANQAKIAGGKQLDLSPIYQDLGEAYLAQSVRVGGRNPRFRCLAAKEGSVCRVRKVLRIGLPESLGLCSVGRTAFQPASRGLRGASGNGRTGSRRGHAWATRFASP